MTSIMDLLENDLWPTQNKDIIQLYSMATPNGQKIGIALEEMEIPYEPHIVKIGQGDQFSDVFKQINPNSRIPALIDPIGLDGQPLAIMESSAILLHLAKKSGKFMPNDPTEAFEALQWLFFATGHLGPMCGQFGHFWKFAKDKCDHPYPLERYTNETRRVLQVMEDRLKERDYMMGKDYTIVDMATVTWIRTISGFYEGTEQLGLNDFSALMDWKVKCLTRPATQRGINVCSNS